MREKRPEETILVHPGKPNPQLYRIRESTRNWEPQPIPLNLAHRANPHRSTSAIPKALPQQIVPTPRNKIEYNTHLRRRIDEFTKIPDIKRQLSPRTTQTSLHVSESSSANIKTHVWKHTNIKIIQNHPMKSDFYQIILNCHTNLPTINRPYQGLTNFGTTWSNRVPSITRPATTVQLLQNFEHTKDKLYWQ